MIRLSNDAILEEVKKRLPEKRFKHSLGVAKAAVELSEIYGVDENSAYVAGIAHDVAKYTKPHEIEDYVNKYEIYLDEYEEKSLALSHSILGSYIARYEFGVFDSDIVNAIRYHTTGRADMSMLEKVVFMADLVEEGRDFQIVDELRELAFGGKIDDAIIMALDNTIMFVIKKGQIIHPRSIEARNFLINLKKYTIQGK